MQNWHTFIQECGDLLQQAGTDSNGLVSGGREASNPVLSVYLGAQAQAQAQVVMGVYRKYWHNAYALTQLAWDEYSVQLKDSQLYNNQSFFLFLPITFAGDETAIYNRGELYTNRALPSDRVIGNAPRQE